MRPISRALVILILCLAAPAGAQEAGKVDLDAGETLYKSNCRSCHGPTAKGLSSYPKLVDKTADYLIDRLERYRAGERFGPNTPLMAPRAKELSDADIFNISHFIDAIEP